MWAAGEVKVNIDKGTADPRHLSLSFNCIEPLQKDVLTSGCSAICLTVAGTNICIYLELVKIYEYLDLNRTLIKLEC